MIKDLIFMIMISGKILQILPFWLFLTSLQVSLRLSSFRSELADSLTGKPMIFYMGNLWNGTNLPYWFQSY